MRMNGLVMEETRGVEDLEKQSKEGSWSGQADQGYHGSDVLMIVHGGRAPVLAAC